MPRMLDDEILGQLERRWQELGTTMLDRMEPGLDDGEIDRIAAPLGFRLPEEVRRVFRWHRGSSLAPFAVHRTLLPLETSVQSTLDFRQDDDDWQPDWLSFMDEKPYIALACGDFDDPVPVWHYDYVHLPPTRPVFASIGELFLFWIELIDNDYMYWNTPFWPMRRQTPQDVVKKVVGVPSD
jgi:hypothetical protein